MSMHGQCQAFARRGRPDRGREYRCLNPATFGVWTPMEPAGFRVCGVHRRAWLYTIPLLGPRSELERLLVGWAKSRKRRQRP